MPKHGGQYAYLKEGLGSWVGFLFTFKLILLDFPAGIAVQAMTFSEYLVNSVQLCGTPGPLVTVTSVTLIGEDLCLRGTVQLVMVSASFCL